MLRLARLMLLLSGDNDFGKKSSDRAWSRSGVFTDFSSISMDMETVGPLRELEANITSAPRVRLPVHQRTNDQDPGMLTTAELAGAMAGHNFPHQPCTVSADLSVTQAGTRHCRSPSPVGHQQRKRARLAVSDFPFPLPPNIGSLDDNALCCAIQEVEENLLREANTVARRRDNRNNEILRIKAEIRNLYFEIEKLGGVLRYLGEEEKANDELERRWQHWRAWAEKAEQELNRRWAS